MKLDKNWFYLPYPDEELKAYETLAFKEYLNQSLQTKSLFPAHNELNFQLNIINSFYNQLNEKCYLQSEPIGIDLAKQEIYYKTENNKGINAVRSIIRFFKRNIEPFKSCFDNLFNEAINSINVVPVGVVPSYQNEGWLLIKYDQQINVFRYDFSNLYNLEGHPAYKYSFIEKRKNESVHQIKLNIVQSYTELPNPATWLVESENSFSLNETFVPIAILKIHNSIK